MMIYGRLQETSSSASKALLYRADVYSEPLTLVSTTVFLLYAAFGLTLQSPYRKGSVHRSLGCQEELGRLNGNSQSVGCR